MSTSAEPQPTSARARTGGTNRMVTTVRAYFALTKPRIIEQLLVATVPAMLLAHRGVPSLWLIAATLAGGALAAGAAGTLNCVVDADIDAVMRRTRARPLARHAVSPRNALIFGLALAAVSLAVLYLTTTLLATALTAGAIAGYVVGYSMLLKRRSPQNVVWGGVAGCMPVLIGWAAVTGTLAWPALAMFGVIFFWTPPHSWALAMKYRDDYRAAGIPMLPTLKPPIQVATRIAAYSWAMVACSLLLIDVTSWLYTGAAALLGAAFLGAVHRLHTATRRGRPPQPMRIFHLSNAYLTTLFLALALDAALGLPTMPG